MAEIEVNHMAKRAAPNEDSAVEKTLICTHGGIRGIVANGGNVLFATESEIYLVSDDTPPRPLAQILDEFGPILYIAPWYDGVVVVCMNTVHTVALDGTTAILANAQACNFEEPTGVCVRPDNHIVVSNTYDLKLITPRGEVSILAGGDIHNYADGRGAAAQFKRLSGIGACSDNSVVVLDNGNACLRRVYADGYTITIGMKAREMVTNERGWSVPKSPNNYNLVGSRPAEIMVDMTGLVVVLYEGSRHVREIQLQLTEPKDNVKNNSGELRQHRIGNSTPTMYTNSRFRDYTDGSIPRAALDYFGRLLVREYVEGNCQIMRYDTNFAPGVGAGVMSAWTLANSAQFPSYAQAVVSAVYEITPNPDWDPALWEVILGFVPPTKLGRP